MPRPTSSQTIGPFFHNALAWGFHAGSGDVELFGRVLDGHGAPVSDAMVELCVPGATGANGLQWLRQPSDAEGQFRFQLPVSKSHAPLAHVCVFARGCFNHHFTAVFAEDATHPMLEAAPGDRRHTLIATRESNARFRWDIHLQGPQETVFFEYE